MSKEKEDATTEPRKPTLPALETSASRTTKQASVSNSVKQPHPSPVGQVSEAILSWIPSLPKVEAESVSTSIDPMHLPVNEVYGDFFVRCVLGRGAFGVVYLAEQLSLKRTVALKVTDGRDDDGNFEGQTMAQLEHPSIVRVYFQATDIANQRRLLCMQYIAGMDLRNLMSALKGFSNEWNGSDILKLLDEKCQEQDAVLGDTSITDRAMLEQADQLNAICWLGAEAAFALSYAHDAGFIHRDVKPENTIINTFGRPMLFDFNLSMGSSGDGSGIVGGTLPYMSPESLEGFIANELRPQACDYDADVYALGVVLWELATGHLPFESFSSDELSNPQHTKTFLVARKTPLHGEKLSPDLRITLQRAIEFESKDRYSSAREFGETLKGVASLNRATRGRNKTLSRWPLKFLTQHPVFSLIFAALLPHVAASALQIAYNQAKIISWLNKPTGDLFNWLLFVVNPIAYPICAALVIAYILYGLRPWLKLRQGKPCSEAELVGARKHLLQIPALCSIVGTLGWIGGAIAFPVVIYCYAGDGFGSGVLMHFIFSFTISCAIGVVFSYSLLLAIAIYVIYPTCFQTPHKFTEFAEAEIGPFRQRFAALSSLAGLVPLLGASLVIASFAPMNPTLTPQSGMSPELAFKALVIGLICSSMVGFGTIRRMGGILQKFIQGCTQK